MTLNCFRKKIIKLKFYIIFLNNYVQSDLLRNLNFEILINATINVATDAIKNCSFMFFLCQKITNLQFENYYKIIIKSKRFKNSNRFDKNFTKNVKFYSKFE